MIPNWQLVTLSIGYIGLLFLIAFIGDKYRHKLATKQHALIYALTLGVYCTSWGFLGTTGQAANYSFSYLPVYIAPILLFIFAWPFIQRVISVSLKLNITSIADLLAARFGKSQQLATIVTLVALIGTLPYIALQLKAIVYSYQILQEDTYLPFWLIGLIVSVILAGFTTIFGIRTIDVTERHPGLMVAIAFESMVKLIAFFTVGCFVIFVIYDSPDTIWQLSKEHIELSDQLSGSNLFSMFGLLIIVMSAFLCLPRQFQVMVVELKHQQHAALSRWLFPIYVLVFAYFAAPMGLAGKMIYGDSLPADSYVLFLPAYNGQIWLTMFSFVGAISAASSMVIVSTIALSTMLSNEIVFPLVFRRSKIQQTDFNRFQRQLLTIRKLLVLGVILLSYGMFMAAPPDTLASLGEVAFGAIAQIGPLLLAAFFWRKVSLKAVLSGIITGFSIWFFANLLPQLGFYPHPLANSSFPATTTATLIGLFANLFAIWLVSRFTRPTVQEQMQVEYFFERPDFYQLTAPKQRKINAKELETLVARFLGQARTYDTFAQFYQTPVAKEQNAREYNEALIFHTEKALASVMGSASAKLVISCALEGREIAIGEVAQLVEDASSQRREFSHSVLQSAIENAREGISVIDSDLNLVAWNKQYLTMFDYPEKLIYIGCPVRELIRYNLEKRFGCSDTIHMQVEKRLQFLRDGSRHSAERELPNGTIIHIEGNPIPGGGFVMIFSDITAYRRSENMLKEINLDLETVVLERTKKLESANDELAKANDALAIARQKAEQAHIKKSQYLKACSHDLIQPLSAARLFSSVLASSKNLSAEEKQHVSYIDNALKTANDLLIDLNEIARIESGNITTKLAPVKLGDVFQSLADEFMPLARQQQVNFHWVNTDKTILTDVKLLRRILQNLLGNALRYAAPGKVLLGCRHKGSLLAIQVIDTGPGIPQDKQQQVFEQFVQLAPQQGQQVKGLGLGLNIARSLAEILNHKISLQSVPGHGCNFSLNVNICAQKSCDEQPKAQSNIQLQGIKVLCVDNEPAVLAGMKELLSRWHCTVLTASNGEQAKLLTQQHEDSIDIILMDYQLDPPENGLSVLRSLQKLRSHHVPAILISATTDVKVIQQAVQLGYGYLPKMIKPDELKALMSELLTKALQENYLASGIDKQ